MARGSGPAKGEQAMTNTIITSDLVEAYSLCPRKAFLLMVGSGANPAPHDYELVVREQAKANCHAHCARLAAEVVPFRGLDDLAAGRKVLGDADLATDGLQARCDFLTKVSESSRLGRFGYEAVKVIGTWRALRPDALGLAYQSLVLGEIQGRLPASGTLVRLGDRPCKVKLAGKYREVQRIVEALRTWTTDGAGNVPPVVLNKHCPNCPFRDACLQQAEAADNLSLLDRMTPKLLRKYHDKGIFTIRQLSHAYRPRRSRKKDRRQVRHSLELQALALRTGKVHVEHLPELPRGPVELVVDLEGVPDRGDYYLAGLLVCKGGEMEYQPFWADDATAEGAMWSALVERLEAFPDAPVFHYGSYEKKAFTTLAKRHGRGFGLADRLVNVASSVYGKVYFPVLSNGLKPLGRFLGGEWTDPQASGLQSLVWRHRWETTRDDQVRQSLLQYNREDCEAVRLLVDRLDRIRREAASDPTIEFAGRPKRHATETGKVVHGQFEQILRSAQADAAGREIRIRVAGTEKTDGPKQSKRKGHPFFRRIVPKTRRTALVEPRQRCPRHDVDLVPNPHKPVERTIIDLVFTRNGCRKTVTKYRSTKSRCSTCGGEGYNPDSFHGSQAHAFGHGLQAWTIYQRVVLRLPYEIIAQVMDHLFGIGLCTSTLVGFIGNLAGYYAPTETGILRAILKSDFVHVDETKINIQGVDHYVWVFTDGQHVVFRMTETREADIVREVLAGYKGVLVSDFYPGYESIPCRQQKCLVHLIRDINDDLWKAPFDKELEAFAVAVQALLVPILEVVNRFGLKVRHLRKFEKDVERFYRKNITGREYMSEPMRTYQKRFNRYRGSLFTFLTQDGIPWNNNLAERAIRQLAVQRKISNTFWKRVAPQYLLLLAISQTCRFQQKSFLKFLLSKETDLDQFRRTKPVRYSYAVPSQEASSTGDGDGSAATEGRDGADPDGPQQG
jgi:predicted RecB family nuclease